MYEQVGVNLGDLAKGLRRQSEICRWVIHGLPTGWDHDLRMI
jgi:hypothetical protein